MNTRKLVVFFGAMFCAGLVLSAQPAFRIPKDVDGVKDVGGSFGGIETVKLVTSTTPALVADADSVAFSNGLIHWIVLHSTDALATDYYLEMRSTDTANVTSARLLPRIYPVEQSSDTAGVQVLSIKPPIPFSNGLSVNLGPTGSAPILDVEFAVGVGPLR